MKERKNNSSRYKKVISAEEKKSVAFQFMVRTDMITQTKYEHTTGILSEYVQT